MQFDIELCVIALIDAIRAKLALAREQCTLLGVSEGGSAALYFGCKYGFPNIVTIVPQFLLGTYVSKRKPTGRFMLGASMPQPHIAALDRLLPGIIAADNQVARNVYLFSSPADYQYEEEIKPHLHLLLKYGNFNLILSNSTLVRGHGEVAAYNTPMLLGILNALSRGATPRFTFDPPQPEPASQAARHLQRLRARKAIAAQLRGARIAEGRIRVAGHALALGYGCGEADPPTRTLVLKRGASEYRVPVASRLDRTLPRRSFDACFCDYSTAGFDTEDGIETAALQPGRYTLHINLSSRDGQLHHTTPPHWSPPSPLSSAVPMAIGKLSYRRTTPERPLSSGISSAGVTASPSSA
ncbi:hypothetical protein [Cupriavidus necator]|uniref:hypothetical protein n=1 Tax=Cupriavidus necator TaxID=106590 RepID=UPI00068A23CA|nr:hypothetical protein [Cupriavidus necator]